MLSRKMLSRKMLSRKMLKRVIAPVVNAFLVSLSSFSVQADDVSILNPSGSKEIVQFRVKVPSTGYDKIITLQPGKHVNAIGTDLWHNVHVEIYGLGYNPCALAIDEKNIGDVIRTWYLPQESTIPGYQPCKHTDNINAGCDCFGDRTYDCFEQCRTVSNAQVTVQ